MSIHSSARQWLLEAPITSSLIASFGGWLPFPLLTDGAKPGHVFDLNLRPHGMTSWRELTEELWGLAEAGLVSFEQEIPSEAELTRQLRIPRETECPIFRNNNSYTLTQAGFEEWERLASPDWDRFVNWNGFGLGDDDSEEVEDQWRLEVTGITLEVTTRAFCTLAQFHQFPENLFKRPVSKVTVWQGLPWKCFPYGWRIQADYTRDTNSIPTYIKLDWDPVHWIRFPVTQDGMRPAPIAQDPTS